MCCHKLCQNKDTPASEVIDAAIGGETVTEKDSWFAMLQSLEALHVTACLSSFRTLRCSIPFYVAVAVQQSCFVFGFTCTCISHCLSMSHAIIYKYYVELLFFLILRFYEIYSPVVPLSIYSHPSNLRPIIRDNFLYIQYKHPFILR